MITLVLLGISILLSVITAIQVWRDVSYVRSEQYHIDRFFGQEILYPWAPWLRMSLVFWVLTAISFVLYLIF